MTMNLSVVAALAGLTLASAAGAETMATASTDLNLRSGPGPTYEILSVIPAAQPVAVSGCLAQGPWCQVAYNGTNGWASGDYLTAMVEAPIYANRERLAVPILTYESEPTAALPVGVMGALAGAVLGGPVGAVIGAGLGAGIGSNITPDERVTTYVRANPVVPVYLDGEVVVGAGVPETVALAEVPESEYYYAYINGVPVLIERQNRRVVYIVR